MVVSKSGISEIPGGLYFQGLLLLVSGKVGETKQKELQPHTLIAVKSP